MNEHMWGEKPYHSLDYEMKQRFGEKIYKLSLQSGLTCPNRDGTLDTRGCIFCSGKGSGDFAAPLSSSVTAQIDEGIRKLSSRKHVGSRFIAYFQSFTNTYAPVHVLRPMYSEALNHPKTAMLSIATRPDCLPGDVLDLLAECNQKKPVMVELGLQTTQEKTAQFIRRGYPLSVYDTAVESLKSRGLEVVTHVIAGLPGETAEDFLQTVNYVGHSGADGIKLQSLHILKHTDLADYYKRGSFQALSMDEYIEMILGAIAILPEHIVIHRLTGDGPSELLIAPDWSRKKRHILNEIHHRCRKQRIWQGKERSNAP